VDWKAASKWEKEEKRWRRKRAAAAAEEKKKEEESDAWSFILQSWYKKKVSPSKVGLLARLAFFVDRRPEEAKKHWLTSVCAH